MPDHYRQFRSPKLTRRCGLPGHQGLSRVEWRNGLICHIPLTMRNRWPPTCTRTPVKYLAGQIVRRHLGKSSRETGPGAACAVRNILSVQRMLVVGKGPSPKSIRRGRGIRRVFAAHSSQTQLSNSARHRSRGESGVRDGGSERTGWETGRSVAGTRRARRRGRLDAREPRTGAVLSRGRQTAYRENRVLLKSVWRGITSRERIGRGCGKQRAAEVHERGTVAGRRRVCAPRRARGAQRACTLVVQLLELREPGCRVHAPPGESFVERGVLRAPIPRFI